MAGLGNTAFAPAVGRGGLPPTRMDSFVFNAGGRANQIYGDEGADSLPPYEEFTREHRINEGIVADRDVGLTTGHGSYLPDAWGNDEFLGAEWSQSGSNYGNRQNTMHYVPNTTQPTPRHRTHWYYRNPNNRFERRFVNLDDPTDFIPNQQPREGGFDQGPGGQIHR